MQNEQDIEIEKLKERVVYLEAMVLAILDSTTDKRHYSASLRIYDLRYSDVRYKILESFVIYKDDIIT